MQGKQSLLSGGGEGKTLRLRLLQCHPVIFRFFGKECRHLKEGLDRAAFTAEPEFTDHAQSPEQGSGAFGKAACASAGDSSRQFEDQVGAGFQCHTGADVFVEQSRFPALHIISAHQDQDAVRPGLLSGFLQETDMPVMQRIEFGNDRDRFHNTDSSR